MPSTSLVITQIWWHILFWIQTFSILEPGILLTKCPTALKSPKNHHSLVGDGTQQSRTWQHNITHHNKENHLSLHHSLLTFPYIHVLAIVSVSLANDRLGSISVFHKGKLTNLSEATVLISGGKIRCAMKNTRTRTSEKALTNSSKDHPQSKTLKLQQVLWGWLTLKALI